ncbi:hypothetical protein [Pseudobacteroides cellulosolvens]|uniref:Uncharacterized protein n=1 Tax=Pseudobacteroides cellulosolvens ATCC 35603 = DSM 2933 TaxID=398512 RepID=A0A0L6JXB6_9FIRM|nr:hypothetical protein [Pseudobacteroides cellulosolvens]KNY30493.1 hypothetical protein Bccel_5773 [Pseudobacteroides cellulosolvens ATCC 35603 = DSM 2933]KNY30496.1 hypothetical protein Bccel_5776 [Pseudobacteroides cellulosolvens ATCC 35603 = DSM 2933]
MSELIKFIENNDINGIDNIQKQLKSGSYAKDIFNDEDIPILIEHLESINDVRLWNSIWSVLLLVSKNDFLIKYCENALDKNRSIKKQDLLHKRLGYLLNCLFKYLPERREELLQDFLNSREITLKFTAAEELANTQLTNALITMIDIYESSICNYDHHDIVDAIDMWICYEGNKDILFELKKRMTASENEKLKAKYKYWFKNIKSNKNDLE